MEYPVQPIPTTRRRHITGTTAPNTPERRRLGGDWHEQSTWFGNQPASLSVTDLTDEATYGRLLDRLGRWGVRDARGGLAQVYQPQT